jgi:hypothetical protein
MSKHSDCANYIPIDVAKGICHANGDVTVQIDAPVCPKFTPGFKCKFCSHYVPGEQNMGTCNGFETEYWAFAENGAKNCEKFERGAEKVEA